MEGQSRQLTPTSRPPTATVLRARVVLVVAVVASRARAAGRPTRTELLVAAAVDVPRIAMALQAWAEVRVVALAANHLTPMELLETEMATETATVVVLPAAMVLLAWVEVRVAALAANPRTLMVLLELATATAVDHLAATELLVRDKVDTRTVETEMATAAAVAPQAVTVLLDKVVLRTHTALLVRVASVDAPRTLTALRDKVVTADAPRTRMVLQDKVATADAPPAATVLPVRVKAVRVDSEDGLRIRTVLQVRTVTVDVPRVATELQDQDLVAVPRTPMDPRPRELALAELEAVDPVCQVAVAPITTTM